MKHRSVAPSQPGNGKFMDNKKDNKKLVGRGEQVEHGGFQSRKLLHRRLWWEPMQYKTSSMHLDRDKASDGF